MKTRAAYHRPFKATATTFNGVRYASRTEASRATVLDLLQRAGEVRWWLTQVTIRLGVPENKFRCDFVVCDRDGSVRAEDTKCIETREFRRNKALWRRYGPFDLWVIKGKGAIEIIAPEGTPVTDDV